MDLRSASLHVASAPAVQKGLLAQGLTGRHINIQNCTLLAATRAMILCMHATNTNLYDYYDMTFFYEVGRAHCTLGPRLISSMNSHRQYAMRFAASGFMACSKLRAPKLKPQAWCMVSPPRSAALVA